MADAAGLRYRWPPLPQPLTILDAFGCGCGFFDYDGDGWQDILLVTEPFPRLFRNEKGRRFTDVTAIGGLDRLKGAWKGCSVGDYDGDGLPDLLLTGYRCLALLRNEGRGAWTNVTPQAGLTAREQWSSGAGFMDLDRDGDLDLVLLNYLKLGKDDQRVCEPKPGIRAGCPPRYYLPQYPEVWRNDGKGRFANVSDAAGMRDATGTAQVLAFADLEDDGDPDFYVGNDGVPADLMLNQGGMRFRNAGIDNGVAYGSDDSAVAAMSADFADYDGDGVLDLFVTAFSGEPYSLLRGQAKATFTHAAEQAGLSEATRAPLGFGACWLDMDNDGWADIAAANGHVYERAADIYSGATFLQPMMLWHNQQGRTFRDVVREAGENLGRPILGRGLARGDYDNDGRMDLLIVNYASEPVLLHNRTPAPHHWLSLDLRAPGKNRFAYGARIEARAAGRRWIAQVSPACSYLSSVDPRVHLGLGSADKLESLVVRWPSGRKQELRDLAVDRFLRIDEGRPPVALKFPAAVETP